MSRENDTSQEPWEEPAEEDSYEGETRLRQRPRSSRDEYDDRSARPRQRPRRAGASRESGRDRPGTHEGRPGPYRTYDPRRGYDVYGRPRQGTRSPRSNEYTTEPPGERPRQTRDSRERTDPYDEVDERYHQQHRMSRRSREEAEARLHQRLRQPYYSREEIYDDYAQPQQRNRPRVEPEGEEFDRRALQPRPRTSTQTTQLPVRKRRRTWSTLLIGCIGGMITLALIVGVIAFVLFRSLPFNIIGIGKTSFTKPLTQQTLPITASVTQLQVHNRVGNITIMVDPAATQGTLTGVKKVQAGNSSDAQKEFDRIKVDVNTSSDQSIVTVNATVPDTSGGLLASDSVDLTLVLPTSVNNIPPFTLSTDVAATGDISVQNFNGVLSLTDNTGNITVKHGLLAAGSCLQTNNGNITMSEGSILDLIYASQLIPCTTNTTQNPHPWFSFKSGTGNVDVTLGTESTNVILDASTNKGKINNDFGLNVQQNSDGSATYHGPLIAGSSPTATFVLAVSTGNINLHKAT
jgi:hypothetical protein